MDLKSLGRRDIFGILLPGTLPIIIGAYAFYAAWVPFNLPIGELFKQEFLVTALLFVSAYLVGSLLRLFAADSVDKQSSKYSLRVWWRNCRRRLWANYAAEFEQLRMELLKGKEIKDPPVFFDDWLWLSDRFPYTAWYNRFWNSHGFKEIFHFFMKHHGDKMWLQVNESPKSFFNYCKLVILDGGGTLAEEVNTAESITRFFAGTYAGLWLSIGLLLTSFVLQVSIVLLAITDWAGNHLAQGLDWSRQSIHLSLSLILILILFWMSRQILERFRSIRLKEVETVFHAFYLYIADPNRKKSKKDGTG